MCELAIERCRQTQLQCPTFVAIAQYVKPFIHACTNLNSSQVPRSPPHSNWLAISNRMFCIVLPIFHFVVAGVHANFPIFHRDIHLFAPLSVVAII